MDLDETQLNAELLRFSQWMHEVAIPGWIKSGFDTNSGSVIDCLLPDGKADKNSVRYLHHQAKWIFTLSRTESVGWGNSYQQLTNQVWGFVSRSGTSKCRSDGYVHQLDANLNILQGQYELSDHALFVSASLAAYAAFGEGGDFRRAVNIMDWLELRFHNSSDGWVESTEQSKVKNLTTHLQLLEAFIYFYEISQKPRWFELAKSLVEVIEQHFVLYDESLALQCGGDWSVTQSQSVWEYQLQITWLMNRYRKSGGEVDPHWIMSLYQIGKNQAREAQYSPTLCSSVVALARALKCGTALSVSDLSTDIRWLTEVTTQLAPLTWDSNAPCLFIEGGPHATSVTGLYELLQAALVVRAYLNKCQLLRCETA